MDLINMLPLSDSSVVKLGAIYGALQLAAQAGMTVSRAFTPRDTIFFKICKAIVAGFARKG